jgi:hypothetical protein
MDPMLDPTRIAAQNAATASIGGTSATTRRFGFRPAFLDCVTMRIHLARFADGRLAPCHLLDGLPDEVVADRLASGRVVRAKATLIAGFERGGYFYTRTAAARACTEWALHD